ncbi:hypothetical protein [Amycolatopsis sp. CA-128772]|uniref:hypothetical protein n=1 Tax=Amycolatopsis sp. CA-128772 TaxID=2073159 RepID=UPI000CD21B9C|nr:hypothetical protein [Amycolatopsis sp. CA-128772]
MHRRRRAPATPRTGDAAQWRAEHITARTSPITTFGYDDAGRPTTVAHGTTILATSTYDAAGEPATVTYANGMSLSSIGRNAAGQETSLTWKTSDGATTVAQVGRSRAGTVIDESLGGVDARPEGPNYVYDTAGRLTEAYVTGHHYTYDFTSPTAATCPMGSASNAGLNTNRVRLLDQTSAGSAETGYCYDNADRLLAVTGAMANSAVGYDTHGNTTQLTTPGGTTSLGWDSDNRNLTVRVTGAQAPMSPMSATPLIGSPGATSPRATPPRTCSTPTSVTGTPHR